MTKEQLGLLVSENNVTKIKDAFETAALIKDVSELLKMYNIKGHKVLDITERKDKELTGEDGTASGTVKVARIPLAYQKKIVVQAAAFLGTPKMKASTSTPLEENFLAIINKTLTDNKFEYKFRTVVKACKSERQSALILYPETIVGAEYWDGFKFDSNIRIRMKVMSKSLGDDLYPVFDNIGDMLAFGRCYEFNERLDGKEIKVQKFELYTADQIIFYVKKGSEEWAVESSATNEFKKIPVVYFTQPFTDFEDVQALIERLETKQSNHADTNDYYDSPIVKAKGDVEGFSEKGEAGKVLKMGQDADAEYMTYDSLPASMKMEMDNLTKFIDKFSSTADTSFESMKGLGHFSIIALKMFFMDPHLKAYDSEEIFGEGAQRLINYLKQAHVILDPTYKDLLRMQIRPEFSYFLPKNVQEEVTVLTSAYGGGIISLETAVKLNPLVENAVTELELIKKESEAKAKIALNNAPNNAGGGVDSLGKIPLALQQLSLAATRAQESGDTALADRLNNKIDDLLSTI